MCMQVQCPQCKKPDWRGCGMHVDRVLAHVPPSERCKCREEAQKPEEAAHAAGHRAHGVLDWLKG